MQCGGASREINSPAIAASLSQVSTVELLPTTSVNMSLSGHLSESDVDVALERMESGDKLIEESDEGGDKLIGESEEGGDKLIGESEEGGDKLIGESEEGGDKLIGANVPSTDKSIWWRKVPTHSTVHCDDCMRAMVAADTTTAVLDSSTGSNAITTTPYCSTCSAEATSTSTTTISNTTTGTTETPTTIDTTTLSTQQTAGNNNEALHALHAQLLRHQNRLRTGSWRRQGGRYQILSTHNLSTEHHTTTTGSRSRSSSMPVPVDHSKEVVVKDIGTVRPPSPVADHKAEMLSSSNVTALSDSVV